MRRSFISLLTAMTLAAPVLAEESAAPAVERTIPSVTVVPASMAEVQARVPVSGTLVARQMVQIYAQVSGYEVTELLAEAGDIVEKGQVLARLSSDTLSAQLAQAEAEYERAVAGVGQAESNITSSEAQEVQLTSAADRARRLRESGNNSQAALDLAEVAETKARAATASAKGELAVAKAALAQADAARRIARLNLERTEITAPVAGLVSARNAELGALSGASATPMFTLIADGAIEMEAEVIETALRSLKPGDKAEIEVAGVGPVEGEVRLIPAAVDPVTRLGILRITLDSQPGLRTGLFASGWVITARREAVTVPATAVLSDNDGERVQVVSDGKVETRPVKGGLLWEGRREIVEGIAEGEQVIARSGAFFRDGDQVRAVTAPDQPAQADTAPENETASVAPPAEGVRQP